VRDLHSGRLHMAPPTIDILHRIKGLGSVDDALGVLTEEAAPRPRPWATGLHPVVRVILAPNAGVMTGPGTNTYIVGRAGGRTFVVDPAVHETSFLSVVVETAGEIGGIVVTHRHPDHVGGVPGLARATGAPVHAFGDSPIEGISVDPVGDGDVLTAGDTRLEVLHTPGHASDHICLVLDDVLFSGDTVLGEGTAVIAPPDGDMRAYLETLRRLRSLRITRVFPGHFRARADAHALIDSYLAHRAEREAAIVAALGDEGASIDDVVARVYTDTPPNLHPLAAYSVRAHLEMAEEDGRVARARDLWVRVQRP
jgi:glyoxylase-like metal-dependent hydrolase (beta-lactamase superfamily II)